MANNVKIKCHKGGLDVVLKEGIPFEDILNECAEKFKNSAKFFGDASMALSFHGRELSEAEKDALLEVIDESCDALICCIIEEDEKRDTVFTKAVGQMAETEAAARGQLYKGTLKAGQVIDTKYSIIVLGDVNPGATIISGGNIVVLGTLYGSAHAGRIDETTLLRLKENDEIPLSDCFVAALEMRPTRITIRDVEATEKAFKSSLLSRGGARIAYRDGNTIKVSSLSKEFLNNIPF